MFRVFCAFSSFEDRLYCSTVYLKQRRVELDFEKRRVVKDMKVLFCFIFGGGGRGER